mmetsp:Transcript_42631/g.120620  ORF Transcript_42631/g.120620 Transcript_42631/m.120620 type:complete len:243 (-) Transcript_42631:184-912(-)
MPDTGRRYLPTGDASLELAPRHARSSRSPSAHAALPPSDPGGATLARRSPSAHAALPPPDPGSTALARRPPPLPPPPHELAVPASKHASVTAVALPTHHGPVGLRTPGGELKSLLEHTGSRTDDLFGADKLDLLIWMAEQVQENIKRRRKMKLALSELNAFLEREGMSPGDAKHAAGELLRLRLRELARLDCHRSEGQASQDQQFHDALARMPDCDVVSCFALVPYTEQVTPSGGSRGCGVM